MLGWGGSTGVGMSVQNVFLGDTEERNSDGLNLDLTSEAELSFPHGTANVRNMSSMLAGGRPFPRWLSG